jgi:type IV secretion system protein VirB4
MLKLADYRSRAKGLPDLLPYAALIAPGVSLNKDGSLLAAWGAGAGYGIQYTG